MKNSWTTIKRKIKIADCRSVWSVPTCPKELFSRQLDDQDIRAPMCIHVLIHEEYIFVHSLPTSVEVLGLRASPVRIADCPQTQPHSSLTGIVESRPAAEVQTHRAEKRRSQSTAAKA